MCVKFIQTTCLLIIWIIEIFFSHTFFCIRSYHVIKSIVIISRDEYSTKVDIDNDLGGQNVKPFTFPYLIFVVCGDCLRMQKLFQKLLFTFCATGMRISHFRDLKRFLLLSRDSASFPGRNLLSVRCVCRSFLGLVNADIASTVKCTTFVVDKICKADSPAEHGQYTMEQ